MDLTDHHFRQRDHADRWRRLTAYLRGQPEGFAIALENLDRWETSGRLHPGPLREWRHRIQTAHGDPEAMEAFLAWLAADNRDAEPLKSCSPFVGLPVEFPEC